MSLSKLLAEAARVLRKLQDTLYFTPAGLEDMARTIWGEAEGEPRAGKIAVGNVILNRKESRFFPQTIHTVIHQPAQFSCWNPGTLRRREVKKVTQRNEKYQECVEIARELLISSRNDNTGGADHYHATYVRPYWANSDKETTRIGDHIFYKLRE